MDLRAIGKALADLRKRKKIGLRQLARMADVSPASLVAIEKGTASTTLATLNKILKALGSNFHQFFSTQPDDPQTPVFKHISMRSLQDENRQYILLFPKRSGLRFEMVLEHIAPNEKSAEWETHPFDLGGCVLMADKALLEVEGIGKWQLTKGDAYYIPAGLKHRLINCGKRPLKQITVASPPKY